LQLLASKRDADSYICVTPKLYPVRRTVSLVTPQGPRRVRSFAKASSDGKPQFHQSKMMTLPMAPEQQERNRSFPDMTRNIAIGLYVVAMALVILGTDFVFRDQMSERLIVRIGILLMSAALYLRFLKRP
jgi:hypothetical protein